jgi:hypothetical protein
VDNGGLNCSVCLLNMLLVFLHHMDLPPSEFNAKQSVLAELLHRLHNGIIFNELLDVLLQLNTCAPTSTERVHPFLLQTLGIGNFFTLLQCSSQLLQPHLGAKGQRFEFFTSTADGF